MKDNSIIYRSNLRFILANLPAIVSLLTLASALFYLLFNQPDIANQYAGFTFYLLIVTIMWKIIQGLIRNKQFRKNTDLVKKGNSNLEFR